MSMVGVAVYVALMMAIARAGDLIVRRYGGWGDMDV